MFSSLSRCKPSSIVETSFTARSALTLDIAPTVSVKVNGALRQERPVSVNKNDLISASLITPSGWSASRKIPYSINGDSLSFMVVTENRSSVNFTLQGLANRWYRYDVDDSHFVSYYDYAHKSKVRQLGFNDVPFAVDIGPNIRDFGPNNFIVKSPTGLRKKRPSEAGSHYDEIVFENDYLIVDKSQEFSLSSEKFTIEIRVKPTQIIQNERCIVGTLTRSVGGETGGWAVTLKSGLIGFRVGDEFELSAQTTLNLNEWNHVAVTRDSISTRIWINGKLSRGGSTNYSDDFEGSLKVATAEDLTLFPSVGNKAYNFIGALSCLRIVKGDNLYESNFEVPEPVLSLTPNTVILTIQEDPGTIYLINVIPDPKTKTVYFYNQFGHLLDNIRLPSEPCQVEKFVSEDGGYFIVSCRNKRLYKITLDKRVINKDYLLSNDGKILEWIFQLPFETDVAFVGTFSTFAKIKNKQINIGQPNSVSISNGKTWVGGYNKIWQIDKYFKILQDFDIVGTVIGLTSLGDKCAAIIKSDTSGTLDLMVFDSSGLSGSIHSAKWLSEPLLHNGYIYVADSARRGIVRVDPDSMTKQIIDLGNNTPSYISSNSSSIFIACHDSNRVLIYSGPGQEIEEVYFPEKVTWVSALENSFMVSHYLKDVQVLTHDRPSVIYEKTTPLTCEKSVAAIHPFKIKNLGVSSYSITVPDDVIHWFDGTPNATVKHGGYFTLSKDLNRSGYHQENVVIGDTVVDYMAVVEDGAFYPKGVSIDPVEATTTKDMVEISFQYKHDFISQFNSAYRAPVYASVNYGFLKRNFLPYTGEIKISDGDIVTVCVPFGVSVPNCIVTLTLGTREFLVPINGAATVTEVQRFVDVERTSKINHTFTVAQTGKYFIPYFKNSVSPDLRLKDVFFGANSTVAGGQFSEDYPIDNLGAQLEAFVPAENGLFDIYLDANYPIVASNIQILIKYGYEVFQVVDELQPIDEDGNPNYVEVASFTKTPVNFNVKASNDQINWVLVKSFAGVPNGPNDWKPGEFKSFEFENTVGYRYWRFENTTTQGLGVSVNSIKLAAKFPSLFSIKKNGSTLNPGVATLTEGDSVSIEISSNDRLYDSIRYFIVGPNNYELLVRNKANETINRLVFNEINEPLIREEYVSEAIGIVSASDESIMLTSFDPLLLMSKNDGDFLQKVSVESGDVVKLKKKIRSVFDTESSVYDIQRDEVNDEFVNVDVIKIGVKNVVLDGPQRVSNKYLESVKHASAKNRTLFLNSLNLNHPAANRFNPIKSQDVLDALKSSLRSILIDDRSSVASNFINSTEIEPFAADFSSIQFNLSVEFNRMSNSVKPLIIADALDFTKSDKLYVSIEGRAMETNSTNFWRIGDFEFDDLRVSVIALDAFGFQTLDAKPFISQRFDLDVKSSEFAVIQHAFNFKDIHYNPIEAIGADFIGRMNGYLKPSSYDYASRLNNWLIFNQQEYYYTYIVDKVTPAFNYSKVLSSSIKTLNIEIVVNYINDLIFTFPSVFSTTFIEEIASAVHIESVNFTNYGLADRFNLIAPRDGDLLYAAYGYDKNSNLVRTATSFPFKNNLFKVTTIPTSYFAGKIKTLSVYDIVNNIAPIEVNYLYVKIDYSTHDRFLYTFKQNGFYGFFDSESDAANEARRKSHTPFKVYGVPQTNKWTYRREYQFIDGCSIGDGRIKRLVQGG